MDVSHLKPKKRNNRPSWVVDGPGLLTSVKTFHQWHVARMFWLENRTASSIARELKTSTNSVKVTLYRLRKLKPASGK